MIERPAARRAPLPGGLGRRVELLGALACFLFAIVAFRLWYLQVLNGRQNVAIANSNVFRDVAIPAPRGLILDSSGRVLATVRAAAVVAVVCDQLPPSPAQRQRLARSLASALALPATEVAAKLTPCDSYAPVTIEADIPSAALIYLAEHRAQFPGVVEQQSVVRRYPQGALAGQVLGFVGQLSRREESNANFKGVPAGSVVGQSGLEYEYDRYLRGTDGVERIQVNAAGVPTGKTRLGREPVGGDDVQTSIDLPLEQEGINAMRVALGLSHNDGYPGTAAAFVALDPNDGRVLALGSVPSFDPNVMSRPYISDGEYAAQAANDAFVDRAISSVYPTGSTFKPISAIAGLEAGLITPASLLGGTGAGGCLSIAGQSFCNSSDADYGANDLQYALEVSEDTYFYQLGALANARGPVIQRFAKLLGLGSPTGIDLPYEVGGYVPTAQSDARINREYIAEFCRHGKHGAFCPG
ncbi:MAG TPA: penicillin-binding transpeptidase domain-containing protein, partial [Solirubrobacteraceae bacterium]|nr:penicillin-binding transpeptidase domain-containing protein [Solirubrobacteraceae bacterium]